MIPFILLIYSNTSNSNCQNYKNKIIDLVYQPQNDLLTYKLFRLINADFEDDFIPSIDFLITKNCQVGSKWGEITMCVYFFFQIILDLICIWFRLPDSFLCISSSRVENTLEYYSDFEHESESEINDESEP